MDAHWLILFRLPVSGKFYQECSTLSLPAFHPDRASVILHHLGNNGQAQAGSLTGLFRGKKGLKNFHLVFPGNTAAGIRHLDLNILIVKTGGNGEDSSLWLHCMETVEDQIQDQLGKLDLIGNKALIPAVQIHLKMQQDIKIYITFL